MGSGRVITQMRREWHMWNRTVVLVGALVVALGAGASAQRGRAMMVPAHPSGLAFVGPSNGGTTQVVGIAVDAHRVPVAGARLRLRDLNTGEILAFADANEDGEFVFPDVEPGSYVVEMILGDRSVVAVSNAGTIVRTETLQTVVQVAGRWDAATKTVVPLGSNWLWAGLSAADTMAGQSMLIAAGQSVPPANAGEPVSP